MNGALSAAGLDEIEQLVSQQYLAVRLRSAQQDPALTISQTTIGPLTFGRIFYDLIADMEAEPMRAIGIVHPRHGRVAYRSRGEERAWSAGELCVHADPDDAFTAALDHHDCDFAIFDPTLLSDVAATAAENEEPVRLLGYRAISPQAADSWLRTLTFVRTLATETREGSSPLLDTHAARLVAAATLATFPSNALLEPTATDRRDAHPPSLRRAVAHIEAHPDQAMSVVDIARAAHVTPRTLQLAFRRHLDTTPMAYLRQVRLDHAHQDLLAATSGDGTTVTGTAIRWGFDVARFAAMHRTAFGETPLEALRR